ncbi:4-aminobutyrate--2-oxoglutarate transaminase [Enterovibrio norvegicus]|uniref:4-aminobutyrate--2-oxoglutarate transaminase n=1 Tax=Enterovibrio norvegicus TaxID=188144 RepID=UPI003552715D
MTTNQQLLQRREAAVARGVASAHPVFAARAENAELWDVEGKHFIDFTAGIAVTNTGHCNAALNQAVVDQMQCFNHTAFQVSPYETYISLCERLNEAAPMRDAKSVLLSTGAEAVENAVKIARHYTGRSGVISFTGGFHGRSLLTMGLTGKILPYKSGFGPFPNDIYHVPFPVEVHGVSVDESIAALYKLFKTDIEATKVAAIILEPVQGEGGFYKAPETLMTALRDICDLHGIVLIFDEVQTGFGRTGKLFASDHFSVKPDLMTVAKALAGGFPLSGVIGKRDIMDSPGPGGLGGTYGGSPIGCAAAHAVLDEIERLDLCKRSEHIGEVIRQRLTKLKTTCPSLPIGDVRGLGAMSAFELVTTDGRTSAPEFISRLVTQAREQGLLLLSCGYWGNTIRLLPPLTIEDSTLLKGLDILESALLAEFTQKEEA